MLLHEHYFYGEHTVVVVQDKLGVVFFADEPHALHAVAVHRLILLGCGRQAVAEIQRAAVTVAHAKRGKAVYLFYGKVYKAAVAFEFLHGLYGVIEQVAEQRVQVGIGDEREQRAVGMQ